MPTNPVHVRHVLQLHQRISSEFPELPIYCVSDGPKGPHPTATFKVLTNTLIRLALFLAGSSSIEDPLTSWSIPTQVTLTETTRSSQVGLDSR
ncbi:hypothetical protein EDD16DRAFT_1670736, partial [Pisolithus croceorrhizus]